MTSPRVPLRCQHEITNITSSWTLDFHPMLPQSRVCAGALELRTGIGLRFRCGHLSWKNRARPSGHFVVKAGVDPGTSNGSTSVQDEVPKAEKGVPFAKFQEIISSMPPVSVVLQRTSSANFVIGFCIATAIFFIVGRISAARKAMHDRPGSVADLVRRGQLRSDRRGISRPLKYEDPFNNPLVKVGKTSSTVEMCGKVYRLAPVTLTAEEQAIHKRRRSRAYQWKRPTIFLKEGDTIPPDVDPDTVRWIPANHPFATIASDIDEDLAQTNVFQKHGVPFRIQEEHEALQRKLESLQREEKFDKLVIDRTNAKDFERPYKLQAKGQEVEQGSSNNQAASSKPSKSDQSSSGSSAFPEEIQKP